MIFSWRTTTAFSMQVYIYHQVEYRLGLRRLKERFKSSIAQLTEYKRNRWSGEGSIYKTGMKKEKKRWDKNVNGGRYREEEGSTPSSI